MIWNVDAGLTYIIIDGLDECEESERQLILKTMVQLSNDCPTLRLAVACRDEKDISRILNNISQLISVNSANNTDISWYIGAQLDELWCEIRPTTPPPGTDICINTLRESLMRKANGPILPMRENP
jgi:hypothetical protein